ncbi:hypothetical protein M3P05_06795 [Sansalvadorimonas sp. 2012CJ34-2]|uniref:Uncharacterized protein n=1 Tax=Parendozoicomonas callyspongiae TaxID=2942213 RepID=A0ABT0PFV4_9GAMM|nr:hypothetical protein [Sansalvadorimonas sp. 2012CJ34-2]MCL6269647.1 hypothetical protein [Sansalvadorimonas sp. 2012CJ34-2]
MVPLTKLGTVLLHLAWAASLFATVCLAGNRQYAFIYFPGGNIQQVRCSIDHGFNDVTSYDINGFQYKGSKYWLLLAQGSDDHHFGILARITESYKEEKKSVEIYVKDTDSYRTITLAFNGKMYRKKIPLEDEDDPEAPPLKLVRVPEELKESVTTFNFSELFSLVSTLKEGREYDDQNNNLETLLTTADDDQEGLRESEDGNFHISVTNLPDRGKSRCLIRQKTSTGFPPLAATRTLHKGNTIAPSFSSTKRGAPSRKTSGLASLACTSANCLFKIGLVWPIKILSHASVFTCKYPRLAACTGIACLFIASQIYFSIPSTSIVQSDPSSSLFNSPILYVRKLFSKNFTGNGFTMSPGKN